MTKNTAIRMLSALAFNLGVLTTIGFMMSGCSDKIPDAEPVKWHKDSALTINQEFLLIKEFKVPKDPHLKNQNWTFQATAEKVGKYLFKLLKNIIFTFEKSFLTGFTSCKVMFAVT